MSVYNEDELVPPSWINQEFLEQVIRQYENNENIKITHVDISPASMKGDHYASIMFRCKVSYDCCNTSPKQKSLIIKTVPTEEGQKRDLLKESSLFETEIEMYTKALPSLEKILTEHGESTKLGAEIIFHSLEPNKVLIFEDLCEAGYDTLRGRYLTEDELKIVYSKLAKLHAASFVLANSEDHECVTNFEMGLFCSSNITDMKFLGDGIINFKDMLSNDELLKVYLENVTAMQPEMMEKCKNLFRSYKLEKNEHEIYVLNHGDLHMKNMMFKFNSEHQVDDLIMVDFQISCFAPSTIDLVYSQYMILSPEFRLRRNEFMWFYFGEFTRMLKQLKFKGKLPKYSDFQISTLKYRHFVLFLMSTFLPHIAVLLNPSGDDLKEIDTAKYVENPEYNVLAYRQKGYIEEMRRLLPILQRDGYLD